MNKDTKMTLHQKTRTLIAITEILALIGLIGFFNLNGFLISVGVFLLFSLGLSGGFHRYFSHRSFETNRIGYWFLLITGTLCAVGSCISWVSQHRMHHAYSDIKEKDPYYAHGKYLKTLIFGPWHVPTSPMIVRDLLRDPNQVFLHNYYFKIQFLYVLILACIEPMLVIWAWAVPGAWAFMGAHVVGVFGHKIGNKVYDTPNLAKNSHLMNLFTLGESYQDTHHYDPRCLVMGPFDLMGFVLKHIFATNTTVK
jgi:stearoyl-CoA desaturase (delta-9 desaturase)